jgi:DNA-binding transcriptional LysR family regulator
MLEAIVILVRYAVNLQRLRYFIAVAEAGHITRAAERLDMQQPPLSRQISLIERELNRSAFSSLASRRRTDQRGSSALPRRQGGAGSP